MQVSGELAPLVDIRSTVTAHNVTAEEFDRMPKSRTFQSVAMTAPSVNQGTIEGGIQVNGASGSENAFTVDGVVTNSLINGQSRQNAVFEYLQEVQVKTVGIPAEFGGALGGVISAVTKSGGNTFRGETHYYYEGSALGAAPPKRLVINPVDDRTVGYFQDSKPTDRRNEIGGSLGGPIVRDRLFFFGSFSPRFNHNVTPYNFSNGTEPDRSHPGPDGDERVRQGHVCAWDGLRVDFSTLLTPTKSEGTLLTTGLNGFGPDFSSISRSANELQKQRGYEVSQRNLSGNVDVTPVEFVVRLLPGRSLLRQLHGHGHSQHDQLHVSDLVAGSGGRAGRASGRCRIQQHAACRRSPTSTGPSGRSSTPTTTRPSPRAACTP